MGYFKNLMIEKMNAERHEVEGEELDDFTAGMQADDWARITGSGLPLPEPEDFSKNVIPF